MAADPDCRTAYLQECKSKYAGLVGFFSNYIPQEVIAAAGFHPLRIIGTFGPSAAHPHAMVNPVCSFVQDVWAAARDGAFSQLDHLIFPNSCDSLKLLAQQWNDEIAVPPAFTLLHPVRADAGSVAYGAEQIRYLAEYLKQAGGRDFTEADLYREIDHDNTVRCLQRRLYAIGKNYPTLLAGSDRIAVITAGSILDRHTYVQLLEQVVAEAESRSCPPSDAKKLLLIGPLVDDLELLTQIERRGVCLIDDDITNGSRSLDRDVETQGDPYVNLAERYLRAAPSPTLYTDPETGRQAFEKRIRTLKPDGVLFIIQKFCEPHIHNYLSKKEILTDLGMYTLMLEIEHNSTGMTERDLLRLESYLEVVVSRS
jgi:benzoyl-CoA reductase/2-hydroxyglutaryl-CoA dehydratase subunit BcrC/BadD/HgdB